MENNIKDQRVLVTGANGFLGKRVIAALLESEFFNIRCFVKPHSDVSEIMRMAADRPAAKIEFFMGNLLSFEDCKSATRGVGAVVNLAAGVGKSYADCFLNSVVATNNLVKNCINIKEISMFLHVSSIAVYDTDNFKRSTNVTEDYPLEKDPASRYEAYSYGKIWQEKILLEITKENSLPLVIVRPGVIFGPGKVFIPGRVGIDTFGVFIHLGGKNRLPITYVDNCANAIVDVLKTDGLEGEVFNIIDDHLPTSREFLSNYKRRVNRFFSIRIPYLIFLWLSMMWEKYSKWSYNQLPPVFNRKRSETYWKVNSYSNKKIQTLVGWRPKISYREAFEAYCRFQKKAK